MSRQASVRLPVKRSTLSSGREEYEPWPGTIPVLSKMPLCPYRCPRLKMPAKMTERIAVRDTFFIISSLFEYGGLSRFVRETNDGHRIERPSMIKTR
jgi:hypothetical protein